MARATDRIEIVLGVGFWTVASITAARCGVAGRLLPFLAAATVGALLWLLVVRHTRAARTFLDWLPLPFAVLTYEMLHAVVPACNPATIDAALQAVDRAIVGGDVATMLEPLRARGLAALLSACYATYYVLPVGLAVRWWRRDRVAFRELLAGVVGGLFIGYLGYLFLPAVGPQAHLPVGAGGGLVAGDFVGQAIRALNGAHDGSFPRDAFPSLHTCNAVTALLVAIRHDRRTLVLVVPSAAGIVVATLFLRWHWLVDVAAGAVLAIAWQSLVPRIVAREPEFAAPPGRDTRAPDAYTP